MQTFKKSKSLPIIKKRVLLMTKILCQYCGYENRVGAHFKDSPIIIDNKFLCQQCYSSLKIPDNKIENLKKDVAKDKKIGTRFRGLNRAIDGCGVVITIYTFRAIARGYALSKPTIYLYKWLAFYIGFLILYILFKFTYIYGWKPLKVVDNRNSMSKKVIQNP